MMMKLAKLQGQLDEVNRDLEKLEKMKERMQRFEGEIRKFQKLTARQKEK